MAAPINSNAVLDYLVTLIAGWDIMQSAPIKGTPQAYKTTVSSHVNLAGFDVNANGSVGVLSILSRFHLTFAYKVGDVQSTEAAETMIATLKDRFIKEWYTMRTDRMGGTVDSVSLIGNITDSPDYRIMAGQEVRLYTIALQCTQSECIMQSTR